MPSTPPMMLMSLWTPDILSAMLVDPGIYARLPVCLTLMAEATASKAERERTDLKNIIFAICGLFVDEGRVDVDGM